MSDELFDVMAVGIDDGVVRWVVEGKTVENAEAISRMAVVRQGVTEQFYAIEPAGKYKVGDKR